MPKNIQCRFESPEAEAPPSPAPQEGLGMLEFHLEVTAARVDPGFCAGVIGPGERIRGDAGGGVASASLGRPPEQSIRHNLENQPSLQKQRGDIGNKDGSGM